MSYGRFAMLLLLLAASCCAAAPPHRIRVDAESDAISNGQALRAAVDAAGASPGAPYLIELGPGTFNLSPAGLVLPQQVSLIGAGSGATTIRLNSPPFTQAALIGKGGNEIARLGVIVTCSATQTECRAVDVVFGTVRLNDVALLSSGAKSNVAVRIAGTLVADGLIAIGQTGGSAVALAFDGGSALVRNSQLSGIAASNDNAAIGGTTSGSVQVVGSRLNAVGPNGASASYVAGNFAQPALLRFDEIFAGRRSGNASCAATVVSGAFLADGCPP